jgi:hypothetical protein
MLRHSGASRIIYHSRLFPDTYLLLLCGLHQHCGEGRLTTGKGDCLSFTHPLGPHKREGTFAGHTPGSQVICPDMVFGELRHDCRDECLLPPTSDPIPEAPHDRMESTDTHPLSAWAHQVELGCSSFLLCLAGIGPVSQSSQFFASQTVAM